MLLLRDTSGDCGLDVLVMFCVGAHRTYLPSTGYRPLKQAVSQPSCQEKNLLVRNILRAFFFIIGSLLSLVTVFVWTKINFLVMHPGLNHLLEWFTRLIGSINSPCLLSVPSKLLSSPRQIVARSAGGGSVGWNFIFLLQPLCDQLKSKNLTSMNQ